MKTYNQFITESIQYELTYNLLNKLEKTIKEFKQYHWNCEGPEFLGYHELFGEIYEKLTEYQDVVAEKLRVAGFSVYIKSLDDTYSGNDLDEIKDLAIRDLVELRELTKQLELLKKASLDNIIGDILDSIDTWVYKIRSGK